MQFLKQLVKNIKKYNEKRIEIKLNAKLLRSSEIWEERIKRQELKRDGKQNNSKTKYRNN